MKGQNYQTTLKAFAFRLTPHQDLKQEILLFAEKNKIRAGCIITCVGSLQQLHLRFANQEKEKLKKGFFEITSLVGTFSNSSAHLHLAVADPKRKTVEVICWRKL